MNLEVLIKYIMWIVFFGLALFAIKSLLGKIGIV